MTLSKLFLNRPTKVESADKSGNAVRTTFRPKSDIRAVNGKEVGLALGFYSYYISVPITWNIHKIMRIQPPNLCLFTFYFLISLQEKYTKNLMQKK